MMAICGTARHRPTAVATASIGEAKKTARSGFARARGIKQAKRRSAGDGCDRCASVDAASGAHAIGELLELRRLRARVVVMLRLIGSRRSGIGAPVLREVGGPDVHGVDPLYGAHSRASCSDTKAIHMPCDLRRIDGAFQCVSVTMFGATLASLSRRTDKPGRTMCNPLKNRMNRCRRNQTPRA